MKEHSQSPSMKMTKAIHMRYKVGLNEAGGYPKTRELNLAIPKPKARTDIGTVGADMYKRNQAQIPFRLLIALFSRCLLLRFILKFKKFQSKRQDFFHFFNCLTIA